MAEITLNNIKQFFQGNTRMFADKIGKSLGSKFLRLSPYLQEQIQYRASKCQDCFQKGQCVGCGCSVPGKWFADEACKEKRWPDLMLKKEDWEAYKKQNNIEIKLDA